MCSVVGYVGKAYSRSYIIDGLNRLEYRGYDSAGFACLDQQANRLLWVKTPGSVAQLCVNFEQQPIDGFIGIGHTRWSTHGVSSQENAHPHFDCNKTIAIVHNGIFENYHELRSNLKKTGHHFISQTDTETVAHLFESLLIEHSILKNSVVALLSQLQGAFACALIMERYPDTILVIRKRSPLCVGQGEGEMFIASDPLAFAGKTDRVIFLPDETFAFITSTGIELFDFTGAQIPYDVTSMAVDYTMWLADAKHGYDHVMLKEIYEQKKVIQRTVHTLSSLPDVCKYAQDVEWLVLVGCGTSYHAARIAQFFFEACAHIPTDVYLASELRHVPFFAQKNTIALALSQSGETADTLESLRFLNAQQVHTVALTNVASSTMVREAREHILTYAGPEIAVASTKSFTAQLATLYWLAHYISLRKKNGTEHTLIKAQQELLLVAEILENTIERYSSSIIKTLAPYYAQFKHMVFLGRHISYPFALEAALKLKEIAYIFTDCYPAGELKHGALALVDAQTPLFLFSTLDPLIYQKLVSNAQAIKARSGHLIVMVFEGQEALITLADYAFIIPVVPPLLGPLAMAGLTQFFLYHIAKVLDRPIDKPRNLAKSVTVE
jgi:glutamine---fructose-6-phosphate transaminase (isomerizing)